MFVNTIGEGQQPAFFLRDNASTSSIIEGGSSPAGEGSCVGIAFVSYKTWTTITASGGSTSIVGTTRFLTSTSTSTSSSTALDSTNNDTKIILLSFSSSLYHKEDTGSMDRFTHDYNTPTTLLGHALTSVPLQVIVSYNDDEDVNEGANSNIVYIHPVLYDFLFESVHFLLVSSFSSDNTSSISTVADDEMRSLSIKQEEAAMKSPCSIQPFPFSSLTSPSPWVFDLHRTDETWMIQTVQSITKLPDGSTIRLQCLLIEPPPATWSNEDDINSTMLDEEMIMSAIAGRWIVEQSLMLVRTIDGYILFLVQEILLNTPKPTSSSSLSLTAFHIGSRLDSFHIQFALFPKDQSTSGSTGTTLMPNSVPSLVNNVRPATPTNDEEEGTINCPGYESLVEEVFLLLTMQHQKEMVYRQASPSGVLLTGGVGVGKTRLACTIARKLQLHRLNDDGIIHQQRRRYQVHLVSVQDLILLATSASEEDMLHALLPESYPTGSHWVLILDDLQALSSSAENALSSSFSSSGLDMERKLVLNSVLQVIEQAISKSYPILGICQDSTQLPQQLTRVGYLEKVVIMSPPSQRQREVILEYILVLSQVDISCSKQWSQWLASTTPGCVSADLRRLCMDAMTRRMASTIQEDNASYTASFLPPTWPDLRLAAQACIPSQLANLDVTKPVSFIDKSITPHDWPFIHEKSWEAFAGYEKIKKRLFRTVVVPWRRFFMKSLSFNQHTTWSSISPPSGVLFHGPTGCGKTLAANCLAASLGLPTIRVRAAEVLDKWLGGSEAVIRLMFRRARAAAPCVLFLDEIDAIASNRGSGDGGGGDVMSRLLSTLLNEMDGVSNNIEDSRILVIACTNRLGSLDAALLRPGRLEEHIRLDLPELDDVKQILQFHLRKVPMSPSVDMDALAEKLFTKLASGAVIEGFCREVVIRSLRNTRSPSERSISTDDVEGTMLAIMQ